MTRKARVVSQATKDREALEAKAASGGAGAGQKAEATGEAKGTPGADAAKPAGGQAGAKKPGEAREPGKGKEVPKAGAAKPAGDRAVPKAVPVLVMGRRARPRRVPRLMKPSWKNGFVWGKALDTLKAWKPENSDNESDLSDAPDRGRGTGGGYDSDEDWVDDC